MAIYWGDYFADTRDLDTLRHGAYLLLIAHSWCHGGHLPTGEQQLATIAGLSLREWRRIRGPIAAKFRDDWTHKRIDAELEKAERRVMQRRIAGQAGGLKSGISRSISLGEALRREGGGRNGTKRVLHGNEASAEAGTKQPRTNHNHIDNLSSSLTQSTRAREGSADENQGPPSKQPAQISRGELEEAFERKRQAAKPPQVGNLE